MNRLKNTRGYLCGAMDFSDDFGVGWRVQVREAMEGLGVVWLDPTDKPMHQAKRGKEEVHEMRELMQLGCYSSVEKAMIDIRFIDLRLVDISDFMVAYLDMNGHHCGTYEEFFRANSQLKPIITIIKQGKKNAPTWLLSVIPYELIFGSIEEAIIYLKGVAHGRLIADFNRWLFFSFHGEDA